MKQLKYFFSVCGQFYLIQGEVGWNCAAGDKTAFHVISIWIISQKMHPGETILRDPAAEQGQYLNLVEC